MVKEKNKNGDWGLGIGDWGLGPIPNPQSPITRKCKKNNNKLSDLMINYMITLQQQNVLNL
jgi:hypothetical protein